MRKKMEIKIKASKETRGNLAFKVCWISIGSRYSEKKMDTKKQAEDQVKHLIGLGFKPRQIAVYKCYDIEKI